MMMLLLIVGGLACIYGGYHLRKHVETLEDEQRAFDPKPQSPRDEDLEYLGKHVPAYLKRQAE
jgi:hypothetical protein